MKAARFRYHAATSVHDAVSMLASESGGGGDGAAVLLAGGQSLVPALSLRRCQPNLLIDITRIEELSRVHIAEGGLVLGSCTTARMIEDELVPDTTRGILARVAACAGPRAVRCRGTIGGNLAAADPVSDWMVSLSALNASATVTSLRGSRTLAVGEIGRPGAGGIMPDEMLVSIHVPEVEADAAWGSWALRLTRTARPEISATILETPSCGSIRCAVASATTGLLAFQCRRPPPAFRGAIASGASPPLDAMLAVLGEHLPGMDSDTVRLMAVALGRAAAAATRV